MGIATSLKRHCVETVSWQSQVVLVGCGHSEFTDEHQRKGVEH